MRCDCILLQFYTSVNGWVIDVLISNITAGRCLEKSSNVVPTWAVPGSCSSTREHLSWRISQLENRRTSPCFPSFLCSPCYPRAPNLLQVLTSGMVGWNDFCTPVVNIVHFGANNCKFCQNIVYSVWRGQKNSEEKKITIIMYGCLVRVWWCLRQEHFEEA